MIRAQLVALAAAATLAAAGAAQAIVFDVRPVSATASSSFTGFAADNASDLDPLTDWSSNGDGTRAFLNLDLGGTYDLVQAFVTDRVTSGGGNGAFVGGVTDLTTKFTLQAFSDASFTTAITDAIPNTRGVPFMPTRPSDFRERTPLDFTAARYIQYRVIEARGPNTGLSDIYFVAVVDTPGIPEPGTWALMILGFAGTGGLIRRRGALVRVGA